MEGLEIKLRSCERARKTTDRERESERTIERERESERATEREIEM